MEHASLPTKRQRLNENGAAATHLNGNGSATESRLKAYRGTVVHSLAMGKVELIEDAAIVVDALGCVVEVIDLSKRSDRTEALADYAVIDLSGRLIIPGFVDGHAHAPQYAFTGTGMDLPLLQWLETYTFPCESKFKDVEFARDVYSKSVARHLRNGTTTCSYFATIHVEACKVLVDVVKLAGQRAYVGKVSMDRNSPDYLIETTSDAMRDAESFAEYCLADEFGREGVKARKAAEEASKNASVALEVEAALLAAAAERKERAAGGGGGVASGGCCNDDIVVGKKKKREQRNGLIVGRDAGAEHTSEQQQQSRSASTTGSESVSNLTDTESDSSSEEEAAAANANANARPPNPIRPTLPSPQAAAAQAAAAYALVTPVITPRFVPSCTVPLLSKLGDISQKLGLPMQTHLSESPGEIAWVRELHPECDSYLGVYERYGLLNERSYFAHCVHCTGGERQMLKLKGGGVIHCPSSNFMLQSGVCDVRRYLKDGCKVGLGTDVAGGYSTSMLDCMRQAVIASRVCSFGLGQEDGDEPGSPLSLQEAFHLATVGSAEAIGLGHAVGNFLPGKQFDALVVSEEVESPLGAIGAPYHVFPKLGQGSRDKFEKFLFLGDDRNIRQVYVAGKRVV